jgi:mannose-6-phosphate isomerase-like protein (cupin superfamily)
MIFVVTTHNLWTNNNIMATCKSSKLSIPDCIPKITKYWSPKLVASINNSYDVKVAKLSGEFVWHSHQDTDELFYIISGRVVIQLNVGVDTNALFLYSHSYS